MLYRTRINYAAEQKAEMWSRWRRGESIAIVTVCDRLIISAIELSTAGNSNESRRFVLKSDIRSYYASIDHILLSRATVLLNNTLLNRLSIFIMLLRYLASIAFWYIPTL